MNKLILWVAALLISGAAQAASSDYDVDFGPYVGAGATSTGAKVRSTSGYTLAVERNWQLTSSGLALGPLIEVANGFVNTRDDVQGAHQIATYDNRIFAAGMKLSQPVGNAGTLAQSLYLAALAGRGYSKLAVDESTDRTYSQSLYGNISGDYFASEFGAFIPLKGNFGINLSLLASLYRANQADATYSRDGNQLAADGSVSLTDTSGNANDGSLGRNVDLKTYAAKIGLALGF